MRAESALMSVLKIAAGVFLGIAAILIALKIPSWIASYQERNAEISAFSLTPDVVIARCGKPQSDTITDYGSVDPGFATRDLEYNGLTLRFFEDSSKSTKTHVVWGGNPQMSDLIGTKYDTVTSELNALTCLKAGN